MMDLRDTQSLTADCMDRIIKCFKPGVKITVLVRTPDHPTRDFIMTDDDLLAAIEALKRQWERASQKAYDEAEYAGGGQD